MLIHCFSVQFLLDDILNEVKTFETHVPTAEPGKFALIFGSLPENGAEVVDPSLIGEGRPFLGCVGDVTLDGTYVCSLLALDYKNQDMYPTISCYRSSL